MSDIKDLLSKTLQTFKDAEGDKKLELAEKLGQVMEGLLKKLTDFSDIPEHFLTTVDGQMLAQISAIDERTEHAADSILGACENMGKAIQSAPDDVKKAIQNEINAIFEASNFQDLVSQHANEIKLLLEDIRADMTDMQDLTGTTHGAKSGGHRSRDKNKRADSHLLNGPALPPKKA